MPNGVLVVFEGVNGAGKTTQVDLLRHQLIENGVPVTTSREPGGTPLGSRLRELLLHDRQMVIEPLAELFLFQADHEQLLAEVVRPALARGEVVLLDRYLYSSVAYQLAGREVLTDARFHAALHALMVPAVQPDCVLLFQPFFYDNALEKVLDRREKHDKIGGESLEFLARVCDSYQRQAAAGRPYWHILDAMADRGVLATHIWDNLVRPLLVERRLLVKEEQT